jgi:chromosome partitioning protein
MRVLSIANQKGGCGKTTTAINLSACLAFKGRKLLLIDIDPQAHSTMGLNVNTNESENTVYEALFGVEGKKIAISDVAVQINDEFDFIPANMQLSTFEQKLSMVPGRENRLKEAIRDLSHEYDYILIDCPPSLGLLTFNSLMASQELLIPIDMGFFSLHGTSQLLEIVDLIQKKAGHKIRIKALATMYDRRTRIAKEILQDIRDHFKDSTYETIINLNVKLKEAASYGKSILDYDINSQGYKDYLALAGELISEERQCAYMQFADQQSASVIPQLVEKELVLHAPHASSVKVAGSFNNWAPSNDYLMNRGDDGAWYKTLSLAPGEYQYKFVIDDEVWVEDENNYRVEIDPHYGKNSVLVVS